MNKYSNCFNSVAVAILVCLIVTPVFAQQTRNDQTEAWRAIDEEFRQAIVEEISLRRGLDANYQNPDWLIESPEDISEALRVSCDISGEVSCENVLSDGEQLAPPTGYTEAQGFENGLALRRLKSGNGEK